MAGVVGPLPVVVDVGAELLDERLVGGEQGVFGKEVGGLFKRGPGLRVDADSAG